MLTFDGVHSHVLARCIERFRETQTRELAEVLAAELRGFRPAQVRELFDELDVVTRQIGSRAVVLHPSPSEPWPSTAVHEVHARTIKRIVIVQRRELAREIDAPRQKTTHREAIGWLERELRILDQLLQLEWMIDTRPARLPKLTDYLSIRHVESLLSLPDAGHGGAPDDKFGILSSASSLVPDLARLRARCELRERSLALVFLDIDDFKAFNTRYGETRIDRDLLAPFMELLEAHAFGLGTAYRQGGDEFVVVLANADSTAAAAFVRRFASALRELRCPGIEPKPTVSAGIVEIAPDCSLTEREALARGDRAKKFAKESGKHVSAGYAHELMREQDLVVLP